jgi:hypothetical protein
MNDDPLFLLLELDLSRQRENHGLSLRRWTAQYKVTLPCPAMDWPRKAQIFAHLLLDAVFIQP